MIVRSQLVKCIKQLVSNSKSLLARSMSSDTFATVSYVTVPNETIAKQLSEKLVKERLAACVNIVRGVESVYEWKGTLEHDSELLLIVKSNSTKSEDLAKFVQEHHPYDCPEVITTRIVSGAKAYLDWIDTTVNQEPMEKISGDDTKSQ